MSITSSNSNSNSNSSNPLAATDRGCTFCQSTRPCGRMDPSLLEPPPSNLFDDDDEDDDGPTNNKNKDSSSWQERYAELTAYHAQHGHTAVPTRYRAHPALGLWVKRQRRDYSARRLSASRTAALDRLDFVWQVRDAVWEQRYAALRQYKQTHGHTAVPTKDPTNPALASWVRCQRHQQQLRAAGRPSTMTAERYAKLHALGFSWRVLGAGQKL